jgi:hypothetical protein
MENLFVLTVMLLSGGYIARRLQRMSSAKRKGVACGGCSNSCAAPAATVEPSAQPGETSLRMR